MTPLSGDVVTEQVLVLGDRPRQDREMDLAVVVHLDHPHDRLAVSVPGKKQGSGVDSGLIAGFAERRPSKPIVVLGVEVGYQLDIERHPCLPWS
jgi:hypothetical protein